MHKYRKKNLSKYLLIVCAVCLVGTVTPNNVAIAQSNDVIEKELTLAGDANARALFAEGKRYHDGDGVTQNYTKARLLYQKAAGMGDNDARINLGYLYFMGQGVEQNYTKARHWYLNAARNGDKSAQENLAMLYEHGLGVDKDLVKAKYWREFSAVKPVAKPATQLKIKAIKNTIPAVTVMPEIALKPDPQPVISTKPTIFSEVKPEIMLPPSPVINGANRDLRGANSVKANDANTRSAVPLWASNSLVGFMLLLALITAVWFVVQYAKLKEQKEAYVFAKAFYAHHRDQLRVNYLRYPPQNRKYGRIDDLWAGAMSTLMVRFAQKQKDEQGLVGEQSRKILHALTQSSLRARQIVFPFVKITQQKIFADIQAHDYKPKSQLTPELIQVSPARKPKVAAIKHTANVVSLQTVRSKKHSSIPPDSLWPDTPTA